MKSIELLAPAKNVEIGIAAINYGADAVYIGATKFGARSAAHNEIEDLLPLIQHAHMYNAKVYVTINTILYDYELAEAEETIHKLYNIGVDAIIIQDMAILQMKLPPIPIFASTQTDNRTPEKIKFLEDVGVQRVILARELSVKDISNIRKQTNIELEAFVHGALCVSYSGQCYMSHESCGRSGNRGECAQMCRMEYDLIDEKGRTIIKNKHLLSIKDLNLSNHLEEMIDAGITSFKIEGRLKDINYVKNVVAYYRRKLDEVIAKKHFKRASSGITTFDFEPDIKKSFNRGYSSYFIGGRTAHIGAPDSPKSIGKKVAEVLRCAQQRIEIKALEPINNGDGLCYFDKNDVLQGFNVNRAERMYIVTNAPQDIAVGTFLYRNNDTAFNKILEINKTSRRIALSFELIEEDNGFLLKVIDEDKLKSKISFESAKELPKDIEKNAASIRSALSKLGNTPFFAKDISFQWTTDYFIPASILSEARRQLIEMHTELRASSYKRVEIAVNKENKTPYPVLTADYTLNISNQLSKTFYENHGVKVEEMAFEIEPNRKVHLMTTKMCVKYENDLCSKYNPKAPKTNNSPLLLRDRNGNIYELQFNCKNCEMTVKRKIDLRKVKSE